MNKKDKAEIRDHFKKIVTYTSIVVLVAGFIPAWLAMHALAMIEQPLGVLLIGISYIGYFCVIIHIMQVTHKKMDEVK